jgi:hypothetical protein
LSRLLDMHLIMMTQSRAGEYDASGPFVLFIRHE